MRNIVFLTCMNYDQIYKMKKIRQLLKNVINRILRTNFYVLSDC